MLIQIGDDEIGAFARIGDRDGAADAAVAAGDDGLLAVQFARSAIGLFAVIGTRLHGVGATGHRLLLPRERRIDVLIHGALLKNLNG